MNFVYLAPKIISMKLALFGRNTDMTNTGKLNLLLEKFKDSRDVAICCYRPLYDAFKDEFDSFGNLTLFDSYSNLPDDVSLFLSLGGDGTFLESLTFIRERDIPVAGINFGRLGFLTTARVGEENSWIDKLLGGNYVVEERTTLNFAMDDSRFVPDGFYQYALNEITIQRRNPVMLEFNVTVDGNPLPTYNADGILIGSATGSTAYSLSIGGPIVTPDSKVLIIAPIAPHNLNVRPLIVPETSRIEISYTGRGEEALLTADNRFMVLPKGKRVTITKGLHPIRCISINNNFINALNQKLLWGEDKRNK